jgi:hypothetical protein
MSEVIGDKKAAGQLAALRVRFGIPSILKTLAEQRQIEVMADDIKSQQQADQDSETLDMAAQVIEDGVPVLGINEDDLTED